MTQNQDRIPTEGNEAPPNTYTKPLDLPEYNEIDKPQYVPNNIPPQPVQQYPQPLNQFVNVNQPMPNPQNDLLVKILEQQNNMMKENERIRREAEKEKHEAEKKGYEKIIHDLEQKQITSEISHLKDLQLATQSKEPVMINNVNTNTNTNFNANINQVAVPVVAVTKLQYGFGPFCLLLLLNMCCPGSGTIVAGCVWGRTVIPDKTGQLICKGIFQLITTFIFIGWIWAVVDALNRFEDGHCFC